MYSIRFLFCCIAFTPVALAGSPVNIASSSLPQYILAVTWQPSFCEGFSHKAECRSQNAGHFDADHFTLHGLWPEPRGNSYCDVNRQLIALDKRYQWQKLPVLRLAHNTRQQLENIMPGVRSFLHRHEWIKHGTCYGTGPEAYFRHSIKLLNQLNESSVREVFAANVGRVLDSRRIRAAFDQAFGNHAGMKVQVSCIQDDLRRLIKEIKINLAGNLAKLNLPQAIKYAPLTNRNSCQKGIVDPIGLQ